MTRVDVVILTWNDGDLLAVAVESVLQQADVDVAVTVVDNGSIPPALVAAPGVRAIRSALRQLDDADHRRALARAGTQRVRAQHDEFTRGIEERVT